MIRALRSLVLLSVFATGASAQVLGPNRTGPVISDYGPVFEVLDTDFATPDRRYRVVFDVAAAPDSPDALNRRIETVARFLNMHASAGVRRENLQAALVLHGPSGKYALSHEAYRSRFGTANPNLALIEALHEADVRIILCGQTAASRGFPKEDLAKPIELALSAMTALIVLQSEGYALIAF